MELAIALLASILFVAAFRKPLATCPVVFYALAVIVDVVFLGHLFFSAAPVAMRAVSPYLNRCLFAFGLLTIVMFIGVLPRDSRLRCALAPIRAELSIVAAILVAGHAGNYLASYVASFAAGLVAMPVSRVAGFAVSVVIVVLLAVLAVTSLRFVKARMASGSWKRVQVWAYVFYGLVYVHLMLLLVPSALRGGMTPLVSIGIYSAIYLAYLVLRVRRALMDGRAPDAYDASVGPSAQSAIC